MYCFLLQLSFPEWRLIDNSKYPPTPCFFFFFFELISIRQDKAKAVDILVNDLKVFSTFNEDLYKEITQLLTLNNFRYYVLSTCSHSNYYKYCNNEAQNTLFSSINCCCIYGVFENASILSGSVCAQSLNLTFC